MRKISTEFQNIFVDFTKEQMGNLVLYYIAVLLKQRKETNENYWDFCVKCIKFIRFFRGKQEGSAVTCDCLFTKGKKKFILFAWFENDHAERLYVREGPFMQQPLISVIVPVYKVEPYLRKCLDSIVGQTYTNLEILLVDDGSPDRCGAICDEYAARDPRIKVIHQENGGLSAARNAALDAAKGEWLGFVDSDDWIEPDMYAVLLEGALRTGADITVCGYWEEFASGAVPRLFSSEALLERDQAAHLLMQDQVLRNYVWDKLFRRELFASVRFPKDMCYEDVAVMHNVFWQARKICCLPVGGYHYTIRSTGIVGDLRLKIRMDLYFSSQKRIRDMWDRMPQERELLQAKAVMSLIPVWSAWLSNPRAERQRYAPAVKEMAAFARIHMHKVQSYVRFGTIGKLMLLLLPYPCPWSFALAWLLGKVYYLKNGRTL